MVVLQVWLIGISATRCSQNHRISHTIHLNSKPEFGTACSFSQALSLRIENFSGVNFCNGFTVFSKVWSLLKRQYGAGSSSEFKYLAMASVNEVWSDVDFCNKKSIYELYFLCNESVTHSGRGGGIKIYMCNGKLPLTSKNMSQMSELDKLRMRQGLKPVGQNAIWRFGQWW